jgi:hypothetical protein
MAMGKTIETEFTQYSILKISPVLRQDIER